MIEADDWDGLAPHMGHRLTVTRTPDELQVICVTCGDKLVIVKDVRVEVVGVLPRVLKGPARPDDETPWSDTVREAMEELIDEVYMDSIEQTRNAPMADRLAWLARRGVGLNEWLSDLEDA